MDVKTLAQLGQDELTDYLLRRLRKDPPLDPPLVERYRQESPESFVLEAVRQGADAAFRERVIAAVASGVSEAQLACVVGEPDEVLKEFIASLAFLATSMRATELDGLFYRLAAGLVEDSGHDWGRALLHSLRATLFLAPGKFEDFWAGLIEDRRPVVREAAYLGLMRANPTRGMRHLPRLLTDDACDRSTLLYSMAAGKPGVEVLARAVRRLTGDEGIKLRELLEAAGADESLLGKLAGFRYPAAVAIPQNKPDTGRRPLWCPSHSLMKNAA